VQHSRIPLDEALIKWTLLFRNCFRHSTAMFRRAEVVRLNGYNRSATVAQDYDLWLRLAQRHRLAALADSLAYYRLPRPGTITHDQPDAQRFRARVLYASVLRELCPSMQPYEAALLRELIVERKATRDMPVAEQALDRLFKSFCESAYTAGMDAVDVNRVRCGPLALLTWSYAGQSMWEDTRRCLMQYLEAGGPVPLAVPRMVSPAVIEPYVRILRECLRGKRPGAPDTPARIGAQYACGAWTSYAQDNMGGFRTLLVKALLAQCTLKRCIVLLVSLFGKTAMRHMLRLRQGGLPVFRRAPGAGVHMSQPPDGAER
jgi:hypothetical protein